MTAPKALQDAYNNSFRPPAKGGIITRKDTVQPVITVVNVCHVSSKTIKKILQDILKKEVVSGKTSIMDA